MKNLFQRIYLFLSAVILVIVSQSSLVTFISRTDGLPYSLDCMHLKSINNEIMSSAPWAMMVLLIVIVAISLFTLLLTFFQNYELQKRLTIFNILVLVGFLVLYGIFYFYYKNKLDSIDSYIEWWVTAIPVVALILNIMTLNAIRSSEAAVLKEATSFRLRD